jgi:hypothetical protein
MSDEKVITIELLPDEYGRPSYAPTWLVEDHENE